MKIEINGEKTFLDSNQIYSIIKCVVDGMKDSLGWDTNEISHLVFWLDKLDREVNYKKYKKGKGNES